MSATKMEDFVTKYSSEEIDGKFRLVLILEFPPYELLALVQSKYKQPDEKDPAVAFGSFFKALLDMCKRMMQSQFGDDIESTTTLRINHSPNYNICIEALVVQQKPCGNEEEEPYTTTSEENFVFLLTDALKSMSISN